MNICEALLREFASLELVFNEDLRILFCFAILSNIMCGERCWSRWKGDMYAEIIIEKTYIIIRKK